MKTISQLSLILVLVLASVGTFAQAKLKFGHIDSSKLLEVMPARDSALAVIQKFAGDLEEAIGDMQKDYQAKYDTYMATRDGMNEFIRAEKEKEIMTIGQRIETFQADASQKLSEKEGALFEPIFAKARKAIEAVALEQGVIYVFDVAEGGGGVVVLYHSEASIDLLPLVKVKLGIS